MTKVKKEKVSAEADEAAAAGGSEKPYQELVANVNQIAQPLASRKLSKKLYKCVKKGKYEERTAENRQCRVGAAKMSSYRPISSVCSVFMRRIPNSVKSFNYLKSLLHVNRRYFHCRM